MKKEYIYSTENIRIYLPEKNNESFASFKKTVFSCFLPVFLLFADRLLREPERNHPPMRKADRTVGSYKQRDRLLQSYSKQKYWNVKNDEKKKIAYIPMFPVFLDIILLL